MAIVPYIPSTAPFTAEQRAWLNGFLAGRFADANLGENGAGAPQPETNGHGPKEPLLILYGSQTGTAEGLAKKIGKEAGKRGFAPRILEMNGFAAVDWTQPQRMLLVTSTWGDGDPPDNATAFWAFLNSDKAPTLKDSAFGVLALGDRNYSSFCGAGKKFDERLEQLGAARLVARAECDTDYETPAASWIESVWTPLSATKPAGSAPPPPPTTSSTTLTEPAHPPAAKPGWARANPFPARLVGNRLLNQPGSAKETRHFEISLEGSGLEYEVGDALGVVPSNSPVLADEIIAALGCSGEEPVTLSGGSATSLRQALLTDLVITSPPPSLLQAVADRTGHTTLKDLLDPARKADLDKYLFGRGVIDFLQPWSGPRLSPAELVALLRKLQPRLYSISSSPKAHPGQVHLTVAVVRYEAHGRKREGVCSSFLADRLVLNNSPLPVFIQTSHGFRLPSDTTRPVIMIGPGTGIAPFRAFLEERRATGAKGGNWLFFGDQCQATDFLYRDELETMRKEGVLTRLDTAFSRDQAEKIYVQNRMIEHGAELWRWLEQGAHVYVCGDAKRMAKDVDAALHQLIQTAGGRTAEQAAEYVAGLKTAKRYQRDVY